MSGLTLQVFDETDALALVREWIENNPEALAESGGELPPELAALLDQFEGPFNDLRARDAAFIKELRLNVENLLAARSQIAARIARLQSWVDALEARLFAQMEAAGVSKVENTVARATTQLSSPAVKHALTNDELAALYETHREFIRVVPMQLHLDSKAVLAAHKAKQPIPPGVQVIQSKHLRIA